MRPRSLRLWSWIVVLAGCGGGEPLPTAPADLRVQASPWTAGDLLLEWTPAASGDGYDLEVSTATTTWVALNSERIPLAAHSVSVRFVGQAPELEVLRFRLRSYRDLASAYSNEAEYRVPIRPPTDVVASWIVSGPVEVGWTSDSLVATAVRLERWTGNGALDPVWVPLEVAPDATGYVDTDLKGVSAVRYRVSHGADGYWSDWQESVVVPIALVAPSDVQVAATADGLLVSWVNHSPSATSNQVEALENEVAPDAVSIDSAASSWLYTDSPYWPTLRFRVSARGPSPEATSELAAVPSFTLEGPLTLAASVVPLPEEPLVARDETGGIYSAGGTWPARLYAPATDGYVVHQLDGDLAWNGIVLDDLDRPHAGEVAHRSAGGVDYLDLVHHFWQDGDWAFQYIAQGVPLDASWEHARTKAFWLGASGLVQAVWQLSTGELRHGLSSASGFWTTTSVPAPGIAVGRTLVAFGPDGTTQVLGVGDGGCVLQQRSPSGVWSEQPVDACAALGAVDDAWLAAGSEGNAAIMLAGQAMVVGTSHPSLWLVSEQGGSLTPPELVAGDASGLALAVRADGTRPVAAAMVTENGARSVKLFIRTADALETMVLGPGAARSVTLGYSRSNELWLAAAIWGAALFSPAPTDGVLFRGALYEEP